jgi:nitrite reductase (NADH) large subunit
VCLADGERLPAQLVVVAIGIRPDMALAQQAGLHCQRGIVVNDALQTSDPSIYALGECVEHRGICYGLVAPLYEQAAVLARQLQSHLHAAPDTPRYAGSVLSTRLKVAGIEVFSAGQIQAEEGDEEAILSDPQGGVYRKLVLCDDRLRGAVLFGDSAGAAELLDCLLHATPLGMLREQLLCAA